MIKYLLTVLLLCLIMAVASTELKAQNTSRSRQAHVAGSWRLDFGNTLIRMEPKQKQDLIKMPPVHQQKVKSEFDRRSFVFASNGKALISWTSEGKKQTREGIWKMEQPDVVRITLEGITTRYKATNISGNQVLLLENMEIEKVGLFKTLYLVKR
jgi:hypothetical protein